MRKLIVIFFLVLLARGLWGQPANPQYLIVTSVPTSCTSFSPGVQLAPPGTPAGSIWTPVVSGGVCAYVQQSGGSGGLYVPLEGGSGPGNAMTGLLYGVGVNETGAVASGGACPSLAPTGSTCSNGAILAPFTTPVPFSQLPLTGWTTIFGFGDSRFFSDAGAAGNRFLNQLAVLTGTSGAITNAAVSGSFTADAVNQVFNNVNPGASSSALQVYMPGINDAVTANGPGPGIYEAAFNNLWMAGASWAATPSNLKTVGSACTQTSGVWTNDTTYSQVTGASASTVNAVLTCPYTTTYVGQQAFVWVRVIGGDGGTYTIADAGGAATQTISTGCAIYPAPATCPSLSILSGTSSVIVVPLYKHLRAIGTYNITITITSATNSGNTARILAVGTAPPAITSTTPFVLAYTLYRTLNQEYAQGVNAYNQDIRNDAALLVGYGLNIGLVNTDNYVFGTSTGSNPEFWNGQGTVPSSCNSGVADSAGFWIHGCVTVQNELVAAAQAPFSTPNISVAQTTAPTQAVGDTSALLANDQFTYAALGLYRVTSAVAFTTSVQVIASWSLPATARTYGLNCNIFWSVSAGTVPTVLFGINSSHTPSSASNIAGEVTVSNAGTKTEAVTTVSALGATTIITSPALTPSATLFQATLSGTINYPALAGVFQVTVNGTGVTTGAVAAGTTCTLQ